MKLSVCLLCAVVAIGCQPTSPAPAPSPTSPPTWDITKAAPNVPEKKFSETDFKPVAEPSVAEQLADLELRVEKMEIARGQVAFAAAAKYQATLDPTAKGFTVIETSLGRFLLADTEVTPYLDGYSVRFKVGNLLAATLTGCKITARWGPPFVRGTNDIRTAVVANEKQ